MSRFIHDHASQVLIPVLLLLGGWLLRRKPDPAAGICLILLCVFVVGSNVSATYIAWLLPFAVLAGWWRRIWIMQALLLGPLIVRYTPLGWPENLGIGSGPFWDPSLVWALWIAPMTALLLVQTAWLVVNLRRGGQPSGHVGPTPDEDVLERHERSRR